MKLSKYTIVKNCTDLQDIQVGISEIKSIIDSNNAHNVPQWIYQRYYKLVAKQEKLTKYFYLSNWDGAKHYFSSIKSAQISASKETGETVCLWNTKTSSIVKFLNCSGYTPN